MRALVPVVLLALSLVACGGDDAEREPAASPAGTAGSEAPTVYEVLQRDERFSTMAARLEHRAALTQALDEVFKKKETAQWLKLLSGRVPVGPVNDMRTALASPFVAASGMVQTIDHPKKRGLRVFTLPVNIDGERPQAVAAEPLKR